jgi:hypothetical protein
MQQQPKPGGAPGYGGYGDWDRGARVFEHTIEYDDDGNPILQPLKKVPSWILFILNGIVLLAGLAVIGVMAYLMKERGMSYWDSFYLCRNKRPII